MQSLKHKLERSAPYDHNLDSNEGKKLIKNKIDGSVASF